MTPASACPGAAAAGSRLHPANRGTNSRVFSLHAELQSLIVSLEAQDVPYALCGALALAVHGHPRATLDIDLLALTGGSERIRRCAREVGFTLQAAPMELAAGRVRIERFSKPFPGEEDVLLLDVLSVAPEIEREIVVETVSWQGIKLRLVSRASLGRLKRLRGSAQDLADLEKLA